MARAKPAWRRALTGRWLRWAALRALTRLFPGLRRRLAFFPDGVGMIEAADVVLENRREAVPQPEDPADAAFVLRCAAHDSAAPCYDPAAAWISQRMTLHRDVWIDVSTGATLLPARGATVLARGRAVNWNLARPRLNRPRDAVEGRVMALLPTANHYHALVDNGLRAVRVAASAEAAGDGLTLLAEAPRTPAQRQLAEAMGRLPGLTVRPCPPGALVAAPEALIDFPDGANYEWAPIARADADVLRGLLERTFAARGEAWRGAAGPRLFLDRGDAKLRGMTNAGAVADILTEAGFERLVATAANLPEQVARFAAARLIVATHGAGLGNLLFARPGAVVVEIFPGDFVKSTYWWMARRLGLRHVALIGGPGDYDQRFAAPLDALRAALAAAAE
jgi:hypothetical protein